MKNIRLNGARTGRVGHTAGSGLEKINSKNVKRGVSHYVHSEFRRDFVSDGICGNVRPGSDFHHNHNAEPCFPTRGSRQWRDSTGESGQYRNSLDRRYGAVLHRVGIVCRRFDRHNGRNSEVHAIHRWCGTDCFRSAYIRRLRPDGDSRRDSSYPVANLHQPFDCAVRAGLLARDLLRVYWRNSSVPDERRRFERSRIRPLTPAAQTISRASGYHRR